MRSICGTAAAPNTGASGHGVRITGSNTRVGGSTAADANLISGNAASGVFIAGGSGSAISGNVISNNDKGVVITSSSGNSVLANSIYGNATQGLVGGLQCSFNGALGALIVKGDVAGSRIFVNDGVDGTIGSVSIGGLGSTN